MTDNAAIISKLKTLINSQTTDDAWISAVNECIGIDTQQLNIEYWNNTFDIKEVGNVEDVKSPSGVMWHRPDGGMSMVVTDPLPQHITLARYLMLARVIKEMKQNNELSFVTVGYPVEQWRHCEVFLNNIKREGIITADALLGLITYYVKNQNNEFVINEKTGEFQIAQISGMVKIVVNKNAQTFF